MKGIDKKWIYLAILSVVWGSSFILIKKALIGLTPLELGALRTLFAAAFLLLIGFRKLKTIHKREWKWIAVSGFLGTFIPAFLFAFAETEIDSAVASILNSTTPIMTLLLGAVAFSIGFTRNQLIGVIIGLVGSFLLIWSGSEINPNQNYWYAGLVLVASVCYACNVNIIKRHLQNVPALAITAGQFSVIIIPAVIVLLGSGFFSEATFQAKALYPSLGYLLILALVGTALAKVLYNTLVQISTPIFASSVTYNIPVIALLWGVLDGEQFGWFQLVATGIILLGVLLSKKT
ncbi:DMT family transporter [Marixanthomonas spongiae]|uniref:Permease n=1 Tax=Marixanthomonas spongiae TaxID=2174845 RepID=A0A2U0I8J0_9FLAO|nr:EamA family transporter [Marixanthomonas spongiae]PVW17398.1 permease [Marixanthomonas spongiae]